VLLPPPLLLALLPAPLAALLPAPAVLLLLLVPASLLLLLLLLEALQTQRRGHGCQGRAAVKGQCVHSLWTRLQEGAGEMSMRHASDGGRTTHLAPAASAAPLSPDWEAALLAGEPPEPPPLLSAADICAAAAATAAAIVILGDSADATAPSSAAEARGTPWKDCLN
jgi:hypothetical protein